MGQGGGEWFTLIITSIFCYCTDRNFRAGAIMCAIATFLQLVTASDDLQRADGQASTTLSRAWGRSALGTIPKKAHDANFSWMWTVAFAMCTIFFLLQFALRARG